MVAIPRNVVVVPGQPRKHPEGYARSVKRIYLLEHTYFSKLTFEFDTLTYIDTLSLIVNCFPKSTITLRLNCGLITSVSLLYSLEEDWLNSEDDAIFAHVLRMYTMRMIA